MTQCTPKLRETSLNVRDECLLQLQERVLSLEAGKLVDDGSQVFDSIQASLEDAAADKKFAKYFRSQDATENMIALFLNVLLGLPMDSKLIHQRQVTKIKTRGDWSALAKWLHATVQSQGIKTDLTGSWPGINSSTSNDVPDFFQKLMEDLSNGVIPFPPIFPQQMNIAGI